ncbi:cell division protein FtsW [PVC group bacterium (ex Bugula neritina AB1)]|nr:cell division protein FtsW [PVC group bacterium (ex Bugula neritina AB1)]
MKKLTGQLYLITIILSLIGLVFIYSTSAHLSMERYGHSFFFAKRQMMWIFLGLIAQMICLKIKLDFYKKYAIYLMLLNIVLLLIVLVPAFSFTAGGARRWIQLGFFRFQPSEFCKLVTVIFVAKMLSLKEIDIYKKWRIFCTLFIFLIGTLALIMAERDLGGTIILSSTIFVMFYISGIQKRYLLGCIGLVSPVVYMAITKYAFRMERLLTYLNPWEDPRDKGYQVIQSMIAISRGGGLGQGLGQSLQKYDYLPESNTDFIFSIYAEETGFLGALILIGLYLYLFSVALLISWKSEDYFSRYLGSGLTFLLAIQVFIHMGVSTALLPTKGTTLPFFSFGGSSLLSNLIAVGLLINIDKFNRKKYQI